MTPDEQIAIDAQRHDRLSDWPEHWQVNFNAERDSLWSQIPEHLQDKARKMAGR